MVKKSIRRNRTDSTEGLQEAMDSAAMDGIMPPKHTRLPPKARPFWNAIIEARAKSEWITNDLVLAAQLARCQYEIEAEQALLEKEHSVLTNRRGTPVMNPRFFVLERLTARELSLSRALRLGAVAMGPARDQADFRKKERDFGATMGDLSPADVSLLAH